MVDIILRRHGRLTCAEQFKSCTLGTLLNGPWQDIAPIFCTSYQLHNEKPAMPEYCASKLHFECCSLKRESLSAGCAEIGSKMLESCTWRLKGSLQSGWGHRRFSRPPSATCRLQSCLTQSLQYAWSQPPGHTKLAPGKSSMHMPHACCPCKDSSRSH